MLVLVGMNQLTVVTDRFPSDFCTISTGAQHFSSKLFYTGPGQLNNFVHYLETIVFIIHKNV